MKLQRTYRAETRLNQSRRSSLQPVSNLPLLTRNKRKQLQQVNPSTLPQMVPNSKQILKSTITRFAKQSANRKKVFAKGQKKIVPKQNVQKRFLQKVQELNKIEFNDHYLAEQKNNQLPEKQDFSKSQNVNNRNLKTKNWMKSYEKKLNPKVQRFPIIKDYKKPKPFIEQNQPSIKLNIRSQLIRRSRKYQITTNNAHKKYINCLKNLFFEALSKDQIKQFELSYIKLKSSRMFFFIILVFVKYRFSKQLGQAVKYGFEKQMNNCIKQYGEQISNCNDFQLKNFRKEEIHQIQIALKAIDQFYTGNTEMAIQYLYKKDKNIIVKQNHFRASLKFIKQLQRKFDQQYASKQKIEKPCHKQNYHHHLKKRYHYNFDQCASNQSFSKEKNQNEQLIHHNANSQIGSKKVNKINETIIKNEFEPSIQVLSKQCVRTKQHDQQLQWKNQLSLMDLNFQQNLFGERHNIQNKSLRHEGLSKNNQELYQKNGQLYKNMLPYNNPGIYENNSPFYNIYYEPIHNASGFDNSPYPYSQQNRQNYQKYNLEREYMARNHPNLNPIYGNQYPQNNILHKDSSKYGNSKNNNFMNLKQSLLPPDFSKGSLLFQNDQNLKDSFKNHSPLEISDSNKINNKLLLPDNLKVFPPIPPPFYRQNFNQKYGSILRRGQYLERWKAAQLRMQTEQNIFNVNFNDDYKKTDYNKKTRPFEQSQDEEDSNKKCMRNQNTIQRNIDSNLNKQIKIDSPIEIQKIEEPYESYN